MSNPTDDGCKEFEKLYKESYRIIDHAINLVTAGKSDEASKSFQEGLQVLDKALSLNFDNLDIGIEQIQMYREMQLKMRSTRKEVLLNFSDKNVPVSSAMNDHDTEEAPPSYDEYLTSLQKGQTSKQEIHYPQLNPLEFKVQTPIVSPVLSPQNGEMIFKIENGVQIFFIYANGRVTSPSYPSFLAIFTFSDPICSNAATGNPGARGFLQVGEWSYPLVPAQSPVLHSFYGAYIFPDPSNSEPGTNVGILIPDTIDKDTKEMFEQILVQMTCYQDQEVPKGVNVQEVKGDMQKSASEMISEGAESLSQGIAWGTDKLSELITFGSDKLKHSVVPEQTQRTVDPKWQNTAAFARSASGSAVRVSGFLLSRLGKATLALGKYLAPTIHKHGTKAIGRVTGQDEKQSQSQVEGVMNVASGAVKGASTIYLSLESAATSLAKSLSDNTVKVVSHKYGPEYGSLTDNTLHAVGQTAMAGHNISSLGVKGIAKRAAKDTGKAILSSYDKSVEGDNEDSTKLSKID